MGELNGMTLGERLKSLRIKNRLTQEELAEKSNTNQKSISAYENDRISMSLDVAKKVAKALNVTIDELVGFKYIDRKESEREYVLEVEEALGDYKNDDEPIPPGKLTVLSNELLMTLLKNPGHEVKLVIRESKRSIPILGRVTAGMKNPVEAIEDIQGWVDTDLPASVEFALRVTGDSMEPSIPDGSIVFVDKSKTARNGNICVVIINGSDAVIKRTYFDPNGVMLRSENLKYEPSFIDREHWESECRIVGVVVRHQVDHI
jgi:repressor LexA